MVRVVRVRVWLECSDWLERPCENSMASSTESPLDTVYNFSCLQDVEHLQCYQRPGQDNISRLICSAGVEGDRRAALMYNVLVALSFVIVPLAAILNIAVVLTILLNRKLHTVINVLVTVLGINNLVWTGLPILLVKQTKVVMPFLCLMKDMLFIVTRGVSFTVIVAITVLRYLMVVRNHSYPAGRRNVLVFVLIAVLPAVVKWLIRQTQRGNSPSACGSPVMAETPDGFLIVAKHGQAFVRLLGIISVVEYGSGLIILAFCYICILVTTIRSKRRVKENEELCRREVQRTTPDANQEDQLDNRVNKRSWAFRRPRKCFRHNGRHSSRASPSPSLPGPSLSLRPTISKMISFALQEASLTGHGNHQTYDSHRRNVNSDGDLLPAVEEVADRQHALPKSPPNAHASRGSSINPNERKITVRALAAERCHGRTAQSHHSPSCSAQEPQFSEGVLLRPSDLLGIEPSARDAPCTPESAVSPRHETHRGPHRTPGRVDVVATFSMTAFIIILFVSIFSVFVGVALSNRRSVCVITAESRILNMIIAVSAMGFGAIVTPIVLVLFSSDFRKAFCSMYDRTLRQLRWTQQ